MSTQFNNPNFRVRVFVYHPDTDEFVTSYNVDQVVSGGRAGFNRVTKAVSDCIEAAQSTDGLRYVCYYPVYESWVQDGNRVFESTIQS